MKSIVLLASMALATLPPAATRAEQEPLLKDSDVKSLSKLVADYFKARVEDDLRKMSKAYEALEKKLESTAKSKKVEDMLISPVDLRAIYGAPTDPEKSLKKGAFYKHEFELPIAGKELKFEYLLYLPKAYSHDVPAPVILCLHPDVGRFDELRKWAAQTYPPELAEAAVILIPLNVEASRTDWGTMEGRMLSFFSLRELTVRYNVDRLKVYLDCHPGTAVPAVDYVTGYPGMFTGVIFRGLTESPATELLVNARNVGFTLLASAGGDSAKLAGDFADEAKAKGVAANVIAEGVGADGVTSPAGTAALVELLGGNGKRTAPEQVVFTTSSQEYVNAYWLHLIRMEVTADKPVTVKGEVDRAKNEVHITTPPDVRAFRVYLNDDLVDMGKSIKLVHTVESGEAAEAVVRFEGTKTRSLERSLTGWFLNLSGNYGEVYTNMIDVELP